MEGTRRLGSRTISHPTVALGLGSLVQMMIRRNLPFLLKLVDPCMFTVMKYMFLSSVTFGKGKDVKVHTNLPRVHGRLSAGVDLCLQGS